MRLAISRYVAFSRAVNCNWQDVIVTQGAQQAIDLVARVVLERGDVVAMEDPGYPPARACFTALGARVLSVPVDEHGLVTARLPAGARLVYVTPSHQFPLGMPMSLARRLELLQWAQRQRAVIVEDDQRRQPAIRDHAIIMGRLQCRIAAASHATVWPCIAVKNLVVPIEQLAAFDEIVDVRTPLEYEEDHIPGALNAPVLSNEERVIIGTLYKTSPFEATRLGAAMVAKNIGHHLETLFADRPRTWRPLIYCWRGGKRSGSMTTWFNLIGWQARQLEGGYKSYRRSVLDQLDNLPPRLTYIALTGHTGTGKTRLLHALAAAGAQVLDLEGLARHRGSLLGALPQFTQPSQKSFDTALASALSHFDPAQPVFVEAESRRIGLINLPAALLAAFHAGRCVEVNAPLAARVAFLLQDYGHLFETPQYFKDQLTHLIGLHSRETVQHWHTLVDADKRTRLFTELVELHYDPAYARSNQRHFSQLQQALPFTFDPAATDQASQARELLARLAAAGIPEDSPVAAEHVPLVSSPGANRCSAR